MYFSNLCWYVQDPDNSHHVLLLRDHHHDHHHHHGRRLRAHHDRHVRPREEFLP